MDVYRTASALAAKGIPVFVCAPNAKNPLTPRGLHDASTDPEVIRGWERRYPDANLAVPTGLRSGLFVVDIDRQPERDGLQTLAALEPTLGALPVTLTATTPSGGGHLYFRAPAVALRNSAGKLGPGIDTRGEGGYVLVPPSYVVDREKGYEGPYRWSVRAPVAELPAAWIEALAPAVRPSAHVLPWEPRNDDERTRADRWCVRALQDEARELAGTARGARNDRLWRAAAALGGLVHVGGIDAEDVRHALGWACAQWGERDARKDRDTLERGLAFGLQHPRRIDIGGDRAA